MTQKNSGIKISRDQWPIVLIFFYPNREPGDWNAYVDTLLDWVTKGEQFLFINDTRASTTVPTPEERKYAIEYFHRSEYAKKNVIGAVTVTKSRIVRGALTALSWVFPPPFPTYVCGDMPEALTWAKEKIRRHSQSQQA